MSWLKKVYNHDDFLTTIGTLVASALAFLQYTTPTEYTGALAILFGGHAIRSAGNRAEPPK